MFPNLYHYSILVEVKQELFPDCCRNEDSKVVLGQDGLFNAYGDTHKMGAERSAGSLIMVKLK